jgi:hypothetical protein
LATLSASWARKFLLLNIFCGEGGCEVFGPEDLADLYVGVACVGVGTALDPLDGLFERLDLPEPEAGDEFLGFGEGAIGDGAVLARRRLWRRGEALRRLTGLRLLRARR